MIQLKIKKPGYTIAIPGLAPFRTPVKIDISSVDIRIVAMYLKTHGIDDYEIIAKTKKGDVEVYTKKEFEGLDLEPKKSKENGIEDRFSRLEKRVEKLIGLLSFKNPSKSNNEEEQNINSRLENIEFLLQNAFEQDNKHSFTKSKKKDSEPEIEEFDSFIPSIDISDMKLKSKEHKTIKQENDDIKGAADALSNLTRGKS